MKTLIESLGPRRVLPPVACQDAKVSAVLDVAEFHHRQPGKDGTTTTFFVLRKTIAGIPKGTVLSLAELHEKLFRP